MEHDNVSGSSEDPNMPVDDESCDNDIMVDCRSSSSSTFSSSSHFEVDIGENDTKADVDIVNGSPKQSPPIQVMSYDSDRILSSKIVKKRRNDSEWSLASNESLFSIHMGNESFSMDGGLTPDAIKSPGLPTVIDTSAENERTSASTNSRNTFALEVNVGGGTPTKQETENHQSSSTEAETAPKAPYTTPEAGGNQWFHCFSCFPMCH